MWAVSNGCCFAQGKRELFGGVNDSKASSSERLATTKTRPSLKRTHTTHSRPWGSGLTVMTLLTCYLSSLFLADLNPSSGTGEVAGQEGDHNANFLVKGVLGSFSMTLAPLLPASWPLDREVSGPDLTAWGREGRLHGWSLHCPGCHPAGVLRPPHPALGPAWLTCMDPICRSPCPAATGWAGRRREAGGDWGQEMDFPGFFPVMSPGAAWSLD